MNYKKKILLCIAISLTISAKSQVPSQIKDSLQSILNTFIIENTIPGGIMAVQHRTDNWIWKGQSGISNINTMQSADTTFYYRIGSISKNFMATTVLHLVDRNILSLNDNIEMWLDSTLFNNIPYGNQMTIRNLLNHTSGLYNYVYDSAFAVNLRTNPNAFFTTDSLINIALSHPPEFIPNTNWKYTNTGFVILTKIIESATGVTYQQYATDSILTPLGINSSYYPDTNIILENHMRCYADYDNNNILEDYTDVTTTWAVGAAEIVSKLDDQLMYFNALIDENIISPSAYNEMITPLPTNSTSSYGLGIYTVDSTMIGHGGIYFNTSGLWYLVDLNVIVAYNFNLRNVDAYSKILQKTHHLLSSNITNIEESKQQKLTSIFPNPVNNILNIVFNENINQKAKLLLYDMNGKLMKSFVFFEENSITLDVSNISSGTYILKIFVENEMMETKKIIIQ